MTSAGWLDQSGQGNDARQTISGSQPDVNLAHPPNLRFDGFNDYMDFTSFTISSNTPFVIFAVVESDGDGGAYLSDGNNELLRNVNQNQHQIKLTGSGNAMIHGPAGFQAATGEKYLFVM